MSALHAAAAAFLALLPITNPIGAVAVFASMTSTYAAARASRTALRTRIYVAAILVVFAMLGSVLLGALGITIPALQLAGGLVVGHSGFAMLNPKPTLTPDEQNHSAAKTDISFSPMALPMVAGPGAIGVVIALAARNPGIEGRVGWPWARSESAG